MTGQASGEARLHSVSYPIITGSEYDRRGSDQPVTGFPSGIHLTDPPGRLDDGGDRCLGNASCNSMELCFRRAVARESGRYPCVITSRGETYGHHQAPKRCRVRDSSAGAG